jgi:hypothetical protein
VQEADADHIHYEIVDDSVRKPAKAWQNIREFHPVSKGVKMVHNLVCCDVIAQNNVI